MTLKPCGGPNENDMMSWGESSYEEGILSVPNPTANSVSVTLKEGKVLHTDHFFVMVFLHLKRSGEDG
jgi:hypothetical protein